MAFVAASGVVLGMVAGPSAGWGLLALLDVLDPNQAIPFGAALLMCAIAPSVVVLAFSRLKRLRGIALGISVGSLITSLVLAVPIVLIDLVFGDF